MAFPKLDIGAMGERLQRGSGTYEDLEPFFERWQHVLGTAVIEPRPPVGGAGDGASDDERGREPLMETVTPVQVERHESMRRMTIYSDGSVPVSELDLAGRDTAGSVAEEPVEDVWARLFARRAQGWKEAGGAAPDLRMLRP